MVREIVERELSETTLSRRSFRSGVDLEKKGMEKGWAVGPMKREEVAQAHHGLTSENRSTTEGNVSFHRWPVERMQKK